MKKERIAKAVEQKNAGLLPGQDYLILTDLTVAAVTGDGNDEALREDVIGGFHTLCADVGDIPGHPFSGYRAGDPLPTSLWNRNHRTKCGNNAGMVYDQARDIWIDIYLHSDSDRKLVHKPLDEYERIAADLGKRLPSHEEFSSLAEGSNELTNIKHSKYVSTTGGHIDTLDRRMISNIGCEDCAGLVWQWLSESDPVDQEYRLLAGGYWNDAANAGSRCRNALNYRWDADTYIGARFVSEPLYPRTAQGIEKR